MSNNDPPYEIGYGKPPEHTRFKKGESGNPKGRPRKAAAPVEQGIELYNGIRQAVEQKITIRHGARVKKVRVREALVTKAVTDALTGSDPKALDRLLKLLEKADRGRFDGKTSEPMRIIVAGGLPEDLDGLLYEEPLRPPFETGASSKADTGGEGS